MKSERSIRVEEKRKARYWNTRIKVYHRLINRKKQYGLGGDIEEYKTLILEFFREYVPRIESLFRDLKGMMERDLYWMVSSHLGIFKIRMEFYRKLHAITRKGFKRGSSRVFNKRGENIAPMTIVNDDAVAELSSSQVDYLKGVDEDIKERVRVSLMDVVKGTASIDEVKSRLINDVEGMTSIRAERIARSEIVKASNMGTLQGFREAGITSYLWLSARDNRVCKQCQELDAGSPYRVGEGPIPVKDSHPNCRCVVVANE